MNGRMIATRWRGGSRAIASEVQSRSWKTSPGNDAASLLKIPDRSTFTFWFLLASSSAAFVFWIVAATSLSKIPLPFLSKPPIIVPASHHLRSTNSSTSLLRQTSPARNVVTGIERPLLMDVWFALSLTVAADAFAVVLTFNGALIRRFHYAVSQRMMFLASIFSFFVSRWNSLEPNFIVRYPLISASMGLVCYALFSLALDRFEKTSPPASQMSYWGTVHSRGCDGRWVVLDNDRGSSMVGFGPNIAYLLRVYVSLGHESKEDGTLSRTLLSSFLCNHLCTLGSSTSSRGSETDYCSFVILNPLSTWSFIV
ncbi:hypothetical protein HIM_06179 [Hirsutella minnesotensis 3608]|uniref:Uncharacterized protein n=1 Tax=Hirsutella minnesotensis 3608 TaxID=1043627 RepID=A0A0F8A4Y1_9HYPO|nr:hypothetical protein HIM_06179 [Hirsutella minnesotensis 3608]